jgi:hypothetical protein
MAGQRVRSSTKYPKFATKLSGFGAVVDRNLNKTLKSIEMFYELLGERARKDRKDVT